MFGPQSAGHVFTMMAAMVIAGFCMMMYNIILLWSYPQEDCWMFAVAPPKVRRCSGRSNMFLLFKFAWFASLLHCGCSFQLATTRSKLWSPNHDDTLCYILDDSHVNLMDARAGLQTVPYDSSLMSSSPNCEFCRVGEASNPGPDGDFIS